MLSTVTADVEKKTLSTPLKFRLIILQMINLSIHFELMAIKISSKKLPEQGIDCSIRFKIDLLQFHSEIDFLLCTTVKSDTHHFREIRRGGSYFVYWMVVLFHNYNLFFFFKYLSRDCTEIFRVVIFK